MATTTLAPRVAAYQGRRSWLYEWLTTTDHKKIGVMYIFTSFLFFIAGGVMALFIRTELAAPGVQFLDPETYNQLFTIHGTTMIFLFVMPMNVGLANYIVPLQIGAADMAFPRINALSFWMVPLGGLLLYSGYAVGGAANAGWTGYAPLSTQGGAGLDLWLMALVLLGMSSVLGAINFLATIFKLRAPGLTLLRMPLFVWNTLVTSVLLLFAIPVITAGLMMLFIDRNYGGGFFDPALGGNPVLWQHVFWFFGHPEVYILILPAFVIATASIGALGFTVWAHHMFTTGAVYLPFFSFLSFLIAVPTGIKFFNWIGTMWRGQLTFESPMLFAIGFLVTFLFGGLSGVLLASPPLDFHVSDTYFVVAHFHYVLFGTIVFAVFAGVYFWFPKMFGRMLDDRLGKLHFWLTFLGFHTT